MYDENARQDTENAKDPRTSCLNAIATLKSRFHEVAIAVTFSQRFQED